MVKTESPDLRELTVAMVLTVCRVQMVGTENLELTVGMESQDLPVQMDLRELTGETVRTHQRNFMSYACVLLRSNSFAPDGNTESSPDRSCNFTSIPQTDISGNVRMIIWITRMIRTTNS
jgi:hypothetical protein